MTLRTVYKKIRKVIIYEIVCNITGERYIGSTIQTIKERLKGHRSSRGKISSKPIIQRNNYQANILETFYTRFELAKLLKEQYYLDNNTNINKLRAIDLYQKFLKILVDKYEKDRRKDEKRINYLIKFRNDNRLITREKQKEERQNKKSIKCRCGGSSKIDNKSHHLKSKRHIIYSVMEEMIATLENNLSTNGK